MAKKAIFILLITLCINCSKEAQDEPNPSPEQKEDVIPSISISQINGLIEKKTNLRVSVSGVSEQTNTKVLINDDELISTNQKDFDFELNPFAYPNGNTTLKVRTEGSSGEVEETAEFEIKKLLFRSFGGLSTETVDSYLAINLQSTGELVAFKKIVTYDDPIFFHADDNFIEEDIIVTQYVLNSSGTFHLARMYGNVKPGTELIDFDQVIDELDLEDKVVNKSADMNINVSGTTFSGLFSLLGRNYSFGASSFPQFNIDYDPTLTSDIFLYYFNQNNEDVLDNYRYAYITELTDQNLDFDEMSNIQSESINSLELPVETTYASIGLFGFSNEQEYREDMFRSLFLNGIETATSGNIISYPQLQEYPIIVKLVTLEFANGNSVLFEQKGIPNLNVPSVEVTRSDDKITISNTHDFSDLTMNLEHPDPENNEAFRMIYRNMAKSIIDIPFAQLEIPEEIINFLTERGLPVQTISNTEQMTLRTQDYENKNFPNGVFHFTVRREYGDLVQWNIPIGN